LPKGGAADDSKAAADREAEDGVSSIIERESSAAKRRPAGSTKVRPSRFGSELAKQFDGFRGAKTAESFDSFDANENVAEGFRVSPAAISMRRETAVASWPDANLIDHHWNDKRMGLGENRGEDERGCFCADGEFGRASSSLTARS